MSVISTANPLFEGDLEGAAHICLHEAVMARANESLPGYGYYNNHYNKLAHQRRARFEDALEKMRMGVESILELGITAEDCDWAAGEARRAVDGPGWELRFRTASMRLKMASLQKKQSE